MHLTVPLVQVSGHGIHQERHIVGDDFNNCVGRFPAVFLNSRIINPQFGRAGITLGGKFPQGQGRAIKVFGRRAADILDRHTGIELIDEILNFAALVRFGTRRQHGRYLGQAIIFLFPYLIVQHG